MWREVEAAIVKIAKEYGYEVVENYKTGDRYLQLPEADEINLTELSKDLVKELKL